MFGIDDLIVGGLGALGLFGSSKASDKEAAAADANARLQQEYLNWQKDYYNKVYGGMVNGDWNSPLYSSAKSDIERSYIQNKNDINRALSARGLSNSGLLSKYMKDASFNRSKSLSYLKPQLLQSAGNFISGTGGAYAQAGNALLNQSALYGKQAQAYGQMFGNTAGLLAGLYL